MSISKAVAVSRAPFSALGAIGFYWGTFAAMAPDIKAQAGASDGIFGLALMGGACGGMTIMYLGPKVSALLGRLTLPSFLAALIIVMQLPVLATSIYILFPVMFVLGAVMSGLDINANMRLSQLEERHGLHLMNINHAMFSLCFGGSALIVANMRQAGWSLDEVLPIMGIAILLIGLPTWEGKSWRPVEPEPEGAKAPEDLPWLFVWLVAIMLFVSFVGENAIEAWSALFIERELGGAPGEGGFGPTTLGLVMAVVRLLGQVTTERLGEERVVFWSGVFGVVGASVISLAPTQNVMLVGIGITAVGMAVIVPTANSLLGKVVHRQQRALAISRAWLFGFTGFFIGPALIGFISNATSLRVAFGVVAVMIATIIPAVMLIKAKRRELG